MIPLKLTLEGIYSYQERQTIDFTELTNAGLFGIFGQTGSGKSSILEAISFALYGETERLNSRDKRAYNMMNLRVKRSYIEFDFENHQRRKFRATREFKRNSKNFDEVKSGSTVFYEFKTGSWEPIENTNAEALLGLSYRNFKRTMIIPQGQFKEFLELGAKDRTEMMKEIFQLQRFDLGDKVAVLNKKNQSELDVLDGKISGYEKVTDEILKELSEKQTAQTKLAEKAQKESDRMDETFRQMDLLRKDFENLQLQQKHLAGLELQKPNFDQKEKELQRYIALDQIFTERLKQAEKLQDDCNDRTKELEEEKKQGLQLQKKLDEVAKSFEVLVPQYQVLPEKRAVERDLELILKILKARADIKELKSRTEKGQELVLKVNDEIVKAQKQADEMDRYGLELESKKLNTEVLLQVEKWFAQHQNLHAQSKKAQENLNALKEEIEGLTKGLSYKDIGEFEEQFSKKERDWRARKDQLEAQRRVLEVQKQLSKYAHDLHDGEACPLCGSPEHPHIAEHNDVSDELARIKDQLKAMEEQESQQQELKMATVGSFQKLKLRQENLRKLQKEFEELENERVEQDRLFVWDDFDATDPKSFEAQKTANKQIETLAKKNRESLKEIRETLEIKRKEWDKFQKRLHELKIEEAQKQTEIDQNTAGLKKVKVEDYEKESLEQVAGTLEDLKQGNDHLEQNYLKLQEEKAQLAPKVAAQNAKIATLTQYLKEVDSALEEVKTAIDNAVKERNTTLEEVKGILSLKLETEKVREQINRFKIDFKTVQNAVLELQKRLENQAYSEERFELLKADRDKINQELKRANEMLATLKSDFARLSKELEEKKTLLKDQSRLQKRAENLKVLFNLFKGAGFVQYVSAMYLRQLCDHANGRFTRMTRNQLSLQVNEENEFEIVDYLNEGRSRSVKTLSGGQAFQVSLSLALALAESVQTSAQAEKNFFFIDEGFGTQDQESVNLVFETLQHLQKENRIVGIISHVEELKEKIPRALTIVKDEQRGSLIR